MLLKQMTIVLPGLTPNEAPTEGQKDMILDGAAAAFWNWFSVHENDNVLTVLGFVKIKLRQVRPVFEKLFGVRPTY